MTLFKRGGIWWSYFYVDGIRYQNSTKTSSKRIAEQIQLKLKEETKLKRFQLVEPKPEMKFSELYAHFVASAFPKPFALDRLKHLLCFFAEHRLFEITKGQAEKYRIVRKEQKPELKDATLNRDLAVLRRVMFWAVDQGYLQASPLSRLPMARERRIARAVLSVKEEILILQICPKHLSPIVICALDTGMRKGEILAQDWNDVDLERKVLYVTKSKTPEGEAREIPLSKRLFELLEQARKPSGPLFTYADSDIADIKRSWASVQKKAGLIRHYPFHSLRHTFATRLMEAGVISDVRRALMGHQAGRDVHAGYTHVELPAKRQAITKLEAWVNRKRKKAGIQIEAQE
jgi:integrase